MGAAKLANELYIVRSVVNSFNNELDSMEVLYAINAKKESATSHNASGSTDNTASSLTDSTISISKLLEYVNKYFPDVLPEEVLKHFGHTERPEGDLGTSALFSERDPYATDSRTLLVNALASAATNEIEKNKLTEYQSKIQKNFKKRTD